MRTIQVSLGSRAYPIHIGPGAKSSVPQILGYRPATARTVVIADDRVAKLHLATLLTVLTPQPVVLSVPPGEESKSLVQAKRIYDALAAARIERDDVILAFGGGMVGDLGGFVAATWLRGLAFVQVPTTLEAAIDASVGGKTAVNHESGKNLIGVFHQPSAVVIDTDFLATLPQRDYVAGLAESVKHALTRAADFLDWHESHAGAIIGRDGGTLVELIARNCAIKAAVVERDERERDLRAVLNFGHTIGHALEHLLGYELRHGECVGLGMLAANELARARGRLDPGTVARVRSLLLRLGLPVRLPRPLDPSDIVAACRMDKKVRAGAVHFILVTAPGQTARVSDVTDAEISAAAAAIRCEAP